MLRAFLGPVVASLEVGFVTLNVRQVRKLVQLLRHVTKASLCSVEVKNGKSVQFVEPSQHFRCGSGALVVG